MESPRTPGAGISGAKSFDRDCAPAHSEEPAPAQESSGPVNLRPYQADAIERIRDAYRSGKRRVLFQLPTGGGKTVIFSFVTRSAVDRRRRVLVLAHRIEIVEQIDAALFGLGVAHGLITAGSAPDDHPVMVASIQTLVRRLDTYAGRFDLVVIDEAHHAVAGTWRTVLDVMPNAKALGVTATPERLDGRGLCDVFDAMICGPGVAELTKLGFLAPARVYAPSVGPDLSGVRTVAGDFDQRQLAERMSGATLVGSAVEHYARLAAGKPTLVFCCSIEHSELVAQRFRDAGWRAEHVDGDTAPDVRRARIAALGNGELDVLTNCSLFGEGVDVPALGAVILMRPTQSLALHLQMIGRALRPAQGKDCAIILDHAGNSIRHGLPGDPRVWSLESKKRRKGAAPNVERNADGELAHREIVERAGSLKAMGELTQLRLRVRGMSYGAMLAWARDPDKLRFAAKARGYRPGWAWHRIKELRRGRVA